jgi:hypothetical protein
MKARYAFARTVLIAGLSASLAVPAPQAAASAILGTARGPQTARLSLNGGKSWLALGGRSLPLLPGTEIRSAAGNAEVTLSEGSRILVMPFSALTFAETSRGIEISLAHGRIAFTFAPRTTVEILTPTVRLEPVVGQPMEGEVFVTGSGLTGVQMTRGTLNVRRLSQPRDVMLAGVEPVFLPARPSMAGIYFSADTPSTPPDARGVFTPDGRSVGYVGRDGALVIEPGYTRDLTRAFSPKLVRLATNAIPDKHRAEDATPLFDVNGGYLGYLAGPVFYAQTPTGPTSESGTPVEGAPPGAAAGPRKGLSTPAIAGIGAVSAVGIGVGAAAAGGAFKKDKKKKKNKEDECPPRTKPATPTSPPGRCDS